MAVSYSSSERGDDPKDTSGSWPVRAGQQPAESCDPPQHNETSVEGRLGENHGGAEGPMEPVSCRTSDDLPHRVHFRGCRGQVRKDHIGPKM